MSQTKNLSNLLEKSAQQTNRTSDESAKLVAFRTSLLNRAPRWAATPETATPGGERASALVEVGRSAVK